MYLDKTHLCAMNGLFAADRVLLLDLQALCGKDPPFWRTGL
jgi:hypothetical protein